MTPRYPLRSLGSVAIRRGCTYRTTAPLGRRANEGDTHMTKNRVLAAGIGMLATAAVLVGCSDDKATATEPATQVSNGGGSEVKVEGKDLAGLDLNSVTCVKQGGKINVASGAIGGQQGL